MGKRGPKPAGGYGERTRVVSTRLTDSTRNALAASARQRGCSLSHEIEHRLRGSLHSDENVVQNLGGPQMYAMLRMIAAAMNLAGVHAMSYAPGKIINGESWLDDPYAFQQALSATVRVLETFRPPGDPSTPPEIEPLQTIGDQFPPEVRAAFEMMRLHAGEIAADQLAHNVASASDTYPAPSESLPPQELLSRRIAAGLGPLHKRIRKGSEK